MNLVLNRIQTPDGTILTSRYRHDYVTHIDANGLEYMVDGGLEYPRRSVHKTELSKAQKFFIGIKELITGRKWIDPLAYKELSVYSDAPFEQIREAFEWGTNGKNGDQPLTWIKLSEMKVAHIKACLKMFGISNQRVAGLMKKELKYRRELSKKVYEDGKA